MSMKASTESNGPRDRLIACIKMLDVYDVLDKYLFEGLISGGDATGDNAQVIGAGLLSVETRAPGGFVRKFCTSEDSLKPANIDQEG